MKNNAKANIKARILMNNTKTGKKRAKQLLKLKKTEVKYLPKGLMSPSHIYIYGNKTAITLWQKEFPFAILITSKEISNRFREFFNWFWELSH